MAVGTDSPEIDDRGWSFYSIFSFKADIIETPPHEEQGFYAVYEAKDVSFTIFQ